MKTASKPAHGTCKWLQRPNGSYAGVLAINGTAYRIAPLTNSLGYLVGYRLTNQVNGKVYTIDTSWSRWECDCPDFVNRLRGPAGCKHCASVAAAMKYLEAKPVSAPVSVCCGA